MSSALARVIGRSALGGPVVAFVFVLGVIKHQNRQDQQAIEAHRASKESGQ